ALAGASHPVTPENLDDILLQASAHVFAGKPEAPPPSAWQQPETALRLQDVWEHRAEHLRLAKQVRIAFMCMHGRAIRCMWNFWSQYAQYQRSRKELRRSSHRLRKAKLVRQLEDAEQAYWDGIFNDGAQAHDSHLTEGVQAAAQEVLEAVARLPMRKALMWAEVPCDLATLLMSWYRSEYALGQRGDGGYTRLNERLSADWSERHATCFADDFLFQWVLESQKACKAMCLDVGVIFEVFASHRLKSFQPCSTMFEVAELWRKKQAETPEQITCSLGVMMLRRLLQELSNRLSHALKSPEVLAALVKQEMVTDKQDWMYMLWDKDNGKLMPQMPRATRCPPRTYSKPFRLEADTKNALAPFLIDVSGRQDVSELEHANLDVAITFFRHMLDQSHREDFYEVETQDDHDDLRESRNGCPSPAPTLIESSGSEATMDYGDSRVLAFMDDDADT
ncbi:unnamed protein product, partial [Symbiodinium microadriaticum]